MVLLYQCSHFSVVDGFGIFNKWKKELKWIEETGGVVSLGMDLKRCRC